MSRKRSLLHENRRGGCGKRPTRKPLKRATRARWRMMYDHGEPGELTLLGATDGTNHKPAVKKRAGRRRKPPFSV